MKGYKRRLIQAPVLGRMILFSYRIMVGIPHVRNVLAEYLRWLWRSNETTNFTYPLHETNKHYLIALVAHIAGEKFDEVKRKATELESDDMLREHIRDQTRLGDRLRIADDEIYYGRRLGWYLLVRLLKPRLVVETGVDKGLGACVLAAALLRNREEGLEGRYLGTDIDPEAGFLFTGQYRDVGEIVYGDSIETLGKIDTQIDFFIHDSDHSAEYEEMEYEAIAHRLSKRAIVVSDNAHVTDKLLRFSLSTQRSFVYFQEKPINHWYPGGGIGVAFAK